MYEEEKTQLSELEEKFKPLEEEYLKVHELFFKMKLLISFLPFQFRSWKRRECLN